MGLYQVLGISSSKEVSMTQLEGLKNFAQNVKPVMQKCKNRQKLTKSEQQSILQFYFEVVDYLAKQ